MKPLKPVLATIPTACDFLGIKRTTLYVLMNANAIRSVKLGKKRLVDVSSMELYAASLPEMALNCPSLAKGAN